MAEQKLKRTLFEWKYGAFVTAVLGIYCAYLNWGENWLLVGFFGVGTLICLAIGIAELKNPAK